MSTKRCPDSEGRQREVFLHRGDTIVGRQGEHSLLVRGRSLPWSTAGW